MGRLERRLDRHLEGRSATEQLGHQLDEYAEQHGRRIRVGRPVKLGRWRTLVIFRAVSK